MLVIRKKESESEVKELLEKRNTLEMERIQLLDKIAELQISIARVHQVWDTAIRKKIMISYETYTFELKTRFQAFFKSHKKDK